MRQVPVCPHCGKKIDKRLVVRWFAAIGGSATKVYSEEEKELKRARLIEARKKRWPKSD